MPITNIYSAGALNLLGLSAQINGVLNLSVDTGIKEEMQYAAGQPQPSFDGIMSIQPRATATITSIATALSNGIGLTGLAFGGALTCTGIDVYQLLLSQQGDRTASGANFKTNFNTGMIIPKSIKASQGQVATMDLEIVGISADGTTAPISFTDSVNALSNVSISELYTLSKVVINGTEVPSVTDVSWDFGLDYETYAATGQVYDTYCTIKTETPRISITSKSVNWAATGGLTGLAQAASNNTIFYFQKMTNMGTRVSTGTAQHVKVTISSSQALTTVKNFGGANNTDNEIQIGIQPIVGAGAILTVSTTSTIS